MNCKNSWSARFDVSKFVLCTRESGQEQVKIASYFLCSLIDETVLNTPWGNQSNWGHHSLLIQFHNEAWGGERFFQILDRLKQQPAQGLNLLELAYLCLSLGFEGKIPCRRWRHSRNRGGCAKNFTC